jgi:hypothetical protein
MTNKLNISVKDNDITNNKNIADQNIKVIFLYSLCLMLALGINNLINIIFNKKHNVIFHIIYVIIVIIIVFILSYRINASISL